MLVPRRVLPDRQDGTTGRGAVIDTQGTSEGALGLLSQVIDQLPLSVAVYGGRPEFLLLYRNQRMAEQVAAVVDFDQPRLEHRGLRRCAERLASSGTSEALRTSVQGMDGRRLIWEWTLSPLVGPTGEVIAVLVVLEDLSEPLLVQQRVEAAVDQGMHLLLDVARLAEEHAAVGEFLTVLSEYVALLVHADSIAFYTYDPSRKLLVACAGSDAAVPDQAAAGLPCDADASDPLSQVVFAGRVYTGTLDFDSRDLWSFGHHARLWLDTGTRVDTTPAQGIVGGNAGYIGEGPVQVASGA